jgi:hypothetical protein
MDNPGWLLPDGFDESYNHLSFFKSRARVARQRGQSFMANRTGADYIKALRDGREVWYGSKRIDDVTTHSGFTGTIKTLADLYDKQHDPEYKVL